MGPHVLAMFTSTVKETGLDNGAHSLDYDSNVCNPRRHALAGIFHLKRA